MIKKNELVTDKEKPELQAITVALTQMLEVAQNENEIKRGDQEVRREEITSNERIALASIEAQREYHKENFSRFNAHLVHRYWFVGTVLVCALIFASFAIWAGAKDLVADLAKLVAGVGVGAFGGFHYGKNKSKQNNDD